jgi:transposase
MGLLTMNQKERNYKGLMEMVAMGKITLTLAAKHLGISYRQVKRIYCRYKANGDAGLVHGNRGRAPNNKSPLRDKIIARYQERYTNFGPTFAAEKLAEDDNFHVDHETLRRWLLKEQLWKKQRKRSLHRSKRERRQQFGELIQIDGSHHDWFSDGNLRCLMNMVDDATGKTLARMHEQETTRAVFLLLWEWIEKYGIPLAIYVDLKNVYVTLKNKGFCHVERACDKLGIRIIKAYSPQAKGRVERNHAVYQDRLVKEIKLNSINSLESANEYLAETFVDHLNDLFEKPARNSASAHRALHGTDLNQILCWEYRRQVQHDWTFSFQKKIYQIKKAYGSVIRPKEDITIRRHLNGEFSFCYKAEKIAVSEISIGEKQLASADAKNILRMSDYLKKSPTPNPWRSQMSELFRIDQKKKEDKKTKKIP